jgi:hypothetical protein
MKFIKKKLPCWLLVASKITLLKAKSGGGSKPRAIFLKKNTI